MLRQKVQRKRAGDGWEDAEGAGAAAAAVTGIAAEAVIGTSKAVAGAPVVAHSGRRFPRSRHSSSYHPRQRR